MGGTTKGSSLSSISLRCFIALSAVLIVAGCGSSAASQASPSTIPAGAVSTTTTAGDPASATAGTITIKNFSFGDPITVRPGATVTVKNTYTETHSLTADDGSFDTSGITPGTSVMFVAPTKPGTYKFHCNFHANMHGSLIVAS